MISSSQCNIYNYVDYGSDQSYEHSKCVDYIVLWHFSRQFRVRVVPNVRSYNVFKNGPLPASFVYFCSFLVTISIQIKKSVDGVLGIRTWGRRMEGADETTELCFFIFSLFFAAFYILKSFWRCTSVNGLDDF